MVWVKKVAAYAFCAEKWKGQSRLTYATTPSFLVGGEAGWLKIGGDIQSSIVRQFMYQMPNDPSQTHEIELFAFFLDESH